MDNVDATLRPSADYVSIPTPDSDPEKERDGAAGRDSNAIEHMTPARDPKQREL